MEKIKNKSGRKNISDELRRTYEYPLRLNAIEYRYLKALRDRFGSKYTASRFRAFLENSYNQHF